MQKGCKTLQDPCRTLAERFCVGFADGVQLFFGGRAEKPDAVGRTVCVCVRGKAAAPVQKKGLQSGRSLEIVQLCRRPARQQINNVSWLQFCCYRQVPRVCCESVMSCWIKQKPRTWRLVCIQSAYIYLPAPAMSKPPQLAVTTYSHQQQVHLGFAICRQR